jgi:hypothetical protein
MDVGQIILSSGGDAEELYFIADQIRDSGSI